MSPIAELRLWWALLAADKRLHFLGGLACAAVAVAVAWLLLDAPWPGRALAGLAVAIVVGWAKEFYDAQHPDVHTYDPADAHATIRGGAVGTVLATVATVVIEALA